MTMSCQVSVATGVEEHGIKVVELLVQAAQQQQAQCREIASRQRFLENQCAPTLSL